MKAFVFSSIAVLFLQGVAVAQTESAPEPASKPSSAGPDADKDGKISREEAQNDKTLSAKFDELDTNKDGFLDKSELKASHQAPTK